MRAQIRALHVIDSFEGGGAERVLATLASVANDSGIDMAIAVMSVRDERRRALQHLFADLRPAPVNLGFARLADPRAFGRLVRTIQKSRCEVVHAHLEDAAIVTVLAARITRRPCVVTLHHVQPPTSRRAVMVERIAIGLSTRLAARLVFVSEAARVAASQRFRPGANWTVIENGVVLPAKVTTKPVGTSPQVVLLAALRQGKGHDVAIAAWPEVLKSVPDANLSFVGAGAEETNLRTAIAEVGLAGSVALTGFRADIGVVLDECDLVVLPSSFEAYPTVLLEAAAAGRAVVASAVGGIPEIVEHGGTGLLVPPGDPSELAAAIVRLLTRSDDRTAMATSARERAEARFDARRWADRLADLYRELRCA